MLNFKFYNYLKNYQKTISGDKTIGKNTFLHSNALRVGNIGVYRVLDIILLLLLKYANEFESENVSKCINFTVVGTKPSINFLMEFSKEDNYIVDETGKFHISLINSLKKLNCYIEPSDTTEFELYLVANNDGKDTFIYKYVIEDYLC